MTEQSKRTVRKNGPNTPPVGRGKRRGAGSRIFSSAEKAIEFLEKLTIPEGKLAGQPLRLAKFQKQFVQGALDPSNIVAILSIGRGNGKTALSSGLALAELLGVFSDQPRREIILAARNRDQAKIAWQFCVGYIQNLPEAVQADIKIRQGAKLEIEHVPSASVIRCIAADAKSILGGAPTLTIMDERAAWMPEQGDALENAILSGLGKRGGKALIISTSAPNDSNTFSRWIDEPPPGTYVQEHRPPPSLPPDDEASLLIANPGAVEGIGANIEWLVGQARRALARGGSALSTFRNLNRNERVSTEDRNVLVTVDEWLAAEGELPPREGPCILGVDLGGSRSMSAAAFYWPDTGRVEALGTFPTSPGLTDRGQSDGVGQRYVEMKDRGELTTMGQQTVPTGPWIAQIVKQLDGYAVTCIVGDRFRHAEFMEALNKAGLGRVPFIPRGMGFRDGSEDVERFRTALFDGRVKVAPSLLLRAAFADAITLVDPAGNEKIAKGRALGRIDAACAVVLAVAEGARRSAQPERKMRVSWV